MKLAIDLFFLVFSLVVILAGALCAAQTQTAWSPGKAVEEVRFTDQSVPRLRYAIELRDLFRQMGRLCDHPEDWDKTTRAIAEGAPIVEIAVCHHDKKSGRIFYRVTARWVQVKDYPGASVVESVERHTGRK